MPPNAPTSLANRLRLPAYILLGMMAVLPLLDLLIVAWPVRPSQVAWRFSTFGQLSAGAAAPLVALLLLYALSYACDDRRLMYTWAILATVYAALLIAATGSFPLDALQMRRRVPAGAQPRFTMGTGVAVLRLGFYALGAATLAVSLFRSAKVLRSATPGKIDPLVMRNLSGSQRQTASQAATRDADPGDGKPAD